MCIRDRADTVTALWLPKIFSAFGTFMLREFFKGLPRSLDEAAMLDGCGFFQIYYRILLPLLKPALSSLAILTAISTFKDLSLIHIEMCIRDSICTGKTGAFH